MRNKLSADPASLILGILSIALLLIGFCCGLIAPIALILGIVGLVMANKSIREFEAQPEIYDHKSRSNVGIGRILSIIGIVLSGLFLLITLGLFLFFGKLANDDQFLKDFRWEIERNQHVNDSIIEDEYDYKYEDSSAIEIDTLKTTTQQ